MTVDFRLTNLDPAEKAVGGYVHTLINIEGGNPPRLMIFPKQELKAGLPVNYRRGQAFLIQRFRPIRAGFDLTDTPQSPSSIRILVYEQSGKLVLNRAFEIGADS